MADKPSLAQFWQELGVYIQLLGVSGVAGAFFRAVFAPESETKRMIVQGIAGAFSAMFLGGILAYSINHVLDAGYYTYLASGFIMGQGGEVATKALQEKILGGAHGRSDDRE